MKIKILWPCTLIALLLVAAPLSASEKIVPTGPSISVGAPAFEFDAVIDGEEVMHDFVIHNKGSQVLEIKNVRTG